MTCDSQTLTRRLFCDTDSESRNLHRCFLTGVIIVVAGMVALCVTSKYLHLWDHLPENISCRQSSARCKAQWGDRLTRLTEIRNEIRRSAERESALNSALTDATNPNLTGARVALDAERDFHKKRCREMEALTVQSQRQLMIDLVPLVLVTVLVSLLVARLALIHGGYALPKRTEDSKPLFSLAPYCGWVILLFCGNFSRELLTSVFATSGKSWFGSCSFCISPELWSLVQLVALGLSMIVAYPGTVLWELGNHRCRRVALDAENIDGNWGVGAYVLFLQTWTLLSLSMLAFSTAVWLRQLRDSNHLSPAYFIPAVVLFGSAAAIVGRMLGSAIHLRQCYEGAINKLGHGLTWRELQDMKLPPDPTISFLGENWWKLPAMLLGTCATTWSIFELLGVARLVTETLSLK